MLRVSISPRCEIQRTLCRSLLQKHLKESSEANSHSAELCAPAIRCLQRLRRIATARQLPSFLTYLLTSKCARLKLWEIQTGNHAQPTLWSALMISNKCRHERLLLTKAQPDTLCRHDIISNAFGADQTARNRERDRSSRKATANFYSKLF